MYTKERTRNQISSKIRALCKKHGYSKYQLAKLSGLSQTVISAILDKERVPNIDVLEKICHVFGISLSEFFAPDDELTNLIGKQTRK